MIRRLIIFLIRKRLGLRKYETFQFANQKSENEYYWFNEDELRKYMPSVGRACDAHVSLNWLLNDNCKIRLFDPCSFFEDED